MRIEFKIEAVGEDGRVFSSSAAGAFPENSNQAEYYALNGENTEEVLKKAIAMISMITAAAANDTTFPPLFDPEKETVTLPNPFHNVL